MFPTGRLPALIDLILDDGESVISDDVHWGRRISFIRLLASV